MATSYPVTDVASLQALFATFTAGDVAILEGYYSPGDGGGGTLTFESTTITSATSQNASIGTASNTTPIRVTTTAPHPFVDGQAVLVSGNGAANGSWIIKWIDASNFDLLGSAANGSVAGGTVTSAVFTSSAPHGLVSGQRLVIAQHSVSAFNTVWPKIGANSSTLFSLPSATMPGAGGTFGDGGKSFASTAASGRWVRTDPAPWNPKLYGAYWDGTINADGTISGHDDTPAWNAMIGAIPHNAKVDVVLPSGFGYMAGTPWPHGPPKVSVKRWCHIRGSGGQATFGPVSTSGIILAPLAQFAFDYGNSSDDGGDSQFSELEHVNVYTPTPIVSNAFARAEFGYLSNDYTRALLLANNPRIEVGVCCIASNCTVSANDLSKTDSSGTHNTVMFRCLSAGTPTGGEPTGFGTATIAQADPSDPNHTISDTGGVTWVCESVPKDRVSLAAVNVGQRWYVPGDNRYIYECTAVPAGGRLGDDNAFNANSFYTQPEPWGTFTDGDATVKVIVASPIMVLAEEVTISHATIVGGFGFGIGIESGGLSGGQPGAADYAYADWPTLDQIHVYWTGGGVYVHGGEANGGAYSHIRYDGTLTRQRTEKDSRMGAGEICIWARAIGGHRFSSCYAQEGHGPGFVSDGGGLPAAPNLSIPGATNLFDDCRSENFLPDLLASNSTMLSGPGQQDTSTDSACYQLQPVRTRGVLGREVDPSAKQTNYVLQGLGAYTRSYALQAGGDIAGSRYHAWWTDKINVSLVKTGLFVFGSDASNLVRQPARWAFGVTYSDAKNTGGGSGPGIDLLYIADGYFDRSDTSYYGTDAAMLTSNRLRGGSRDVGDSFPIPGATHAVGTPRRCTVVGAGYRGVRWTSSLQYYVEDNGATTLSEALIVEPSAAAPVFTDGSTRCWKWDGTGPGNLGAGHEPAWPASGNFVDADGNGWIDMGPSAIVQASDPVIDNRQFEPQILAVDMTLQDETVTTTRSVVQATGTPGVVRTLTWNGATAGDRRIFDNQCNAAVKIAPATGDLGLNGVASQKCAVVYFDGSHWRRASSDATP